MRKYTKDYADEIIEMLKSGMNYSQIGREVGIGYNAIAKFAKERGYYSNLVDPNTGEPKRIENYKNMIIGMHLDGMNSLEIADHVPFHYQSVRDFLKQEGHGAEFADYSDIEEILSQDYIDGLNGTELAEKYDIPCHAVYTILNRQGVEKRSYAEAGRIYNANDFSFSFETLDDLSSEARYWIGFLMADGCVYERKNNSPMLKLALAAKDREHLVKFKNFLQAENPIHPKKTVNEYGKKEITAYEIIISSEQLAKDLAKFGVVPRKSHIAEVKLLENDSSFWRGCIDGDGCIYDYGNSLTKRLNLVGSKKLLDQFRDFCNNVVGINTRAKSHPKTNTTIYQFQLSSNMAKKVIEHLYKNATIYLDRKNPFHNFNT